MPPSQSNFLTAKTSQAGRSTSSTPRLKPENVWSVADGILICKGRPPGVIRTFKDYSNYELTIEWRWPSDSKPGNSGVLIHASKPKEIFAWPKSIEVHFHKVELTQIK